MTSITEFEHALLKQLADIEDLGKGPDSWGAAVGAAFESLKGFGYIDRLGFPTEKGLEKAKEPYGVQP